MFKINRSKKAYKPIIGMAIVSQLLVGTNASAEEITFKIAATTDVHGNFFPYDFISKSPGEGSLARVATRIRQLRDSVGDDHVILLDNGDILQGQPTAYYYNFIATDVKHPVARMLAYLAYDAETIGNHDVETGHAVYDRYRKDLGSIPLLGANVIDDSTGNPYLQPYKIIEKEALKLQYLACLHRLFLPGFLRICGVVCGLRICWNPLRSGCLILSKRKNRICL